MARFTKWEVDMIDIERLRKEMLDDCLAMVFGAGIGAGIWEAAEIETASPEKLIEMARQQGIDLSRFEE